MVTKIIIVKTLNTIMIKKKDKEIKKLFSLIFNNIGNSNQNKK